LAAAPWWVAFSVVCLHVSGMGLGCWRLLLQKLCRKQAENNRHKGMCLDGNRMFILKNADFIKDSGIGNG